MAMVGVVVGLGRGALRETARAAALRIMVAEFEGFDDGQDFLEFVGCREEKFRFHGRFEEKTWPDSN